MSLRAAIVFLGLALSLLVIPPVRADDSPTRRRELDAQSQELRESIRLLESTRTRLGYSGDDLRRRNELGNLVSRKRSELNAVEALRSGTYGRPTPETVDRLERQLGDAGNRATREEIRLLETEKNRLGHGGDDLRRRNEMGSLISRKRAVLNAQAYGGYADSPSGQRRQLDAEARELREEMRLLENERNRLGYSGEDLRRRNELSNLVSRKRDLLSAKERSKSP